MGVMRNGPPRVHVVAKRIVKRLIYGGAESSSPLRTCSI